MDRERKIELINRSLGLRHKLKVHESGKAPETHAELAVMMLAKWELEDELRAIEEILAELRTANVHAKREQMDLKTKETDSGQDDSHTLVSDALITNPNGEEDAEEEPAPVRPKGKKGR